MRLDKENCINFDTDIGTLTSGATTQIGDIIDAVKPGGSKDEMYLVVSVRTAVTSATSAATLNIKVLNDSASDFGTADTIYESGALALTALTTGTRLYARKLPFSLKRYLKATGTVAVEDVTGGEIDIFLVDEADFQAMNSAS